MSKTFAIIKPDAVQKKEAIGLILQKISDYGFIIDEMRMERLTKEKAQEFYAEHEGKPFFDDLCDFMSSGKCVVLQLEREHAVKSWRYLIGATNPKEAEEFTIRHAFGESVDRNAVHGSDSDESAERELKFFFG